VTYKGRVLYEVGYILLITKQKQGEKMEMKVEEEGQVLIRMHD
jgi:hypothetical protein